MTQQDLEQMIMDKVSTHDSNITIDNIEFVQRRSPSRMDVDIKAHYGKAVEPEVTEQSNTGSKQESPAKEPVPTKTEKPVKEEEPKTDESVNDIFSGID